MVLGKTAEYYVAYFLIKLGYNTSVVNHQGFDLISIIKNKPYRIEVKSSKTKIKDRNGFRFATKQGPTGNKRYLTEDMASDIVAFVSMLKPPRIFFKPTYKITSISHSIYSIHFKNPTLEQDSLMQSLSEIS